MAVPRSCSWSSWSPRSSCRTQRRAPTSGPRTRSATAVLGVILARPVAHADPAAAGRRPRVGADAGVPGRLAHGAVGPHRRRRVPEQGALRPHRAARGGDAGALRRPAPRQATRPSTSCAACGPCSRPPTRAGNQAVDAAPVLGAAFVVLVIVVIGYALYRRRDLGTSAGRATFDTLHTASLAAPSLREGLTEAGAERAVRHLRSAARHGRPWRSPTARARSPSTRISHHHAAARDRARPGHAGARAHRHPRRPRRSRAARRTARCARAVAARSSTATPWSGALVAYGARHAGHAGAGRRGGRPLGVRPARTGQRPTRSARS